MNTWSLSWRGDAATLVDCGISGRTWQCKWQHAAKSRLMASTAAMAGKRWWHRAVAFNFELTFQLGVHPSMKKEKKKGTDVCIIRQPQSRLIVRSAVITSMMNSLIVQREASCSCQLHATTLDAEIDKRKEILYYYKLMKKTLLTVKQI